MAWSRSVKRNARLFSLRCSPAIGHDGNRCDCFDRTLLAWVTSHTGDVCDASDSQSGPTRLMARAESLAGFAVKIFVKEHKVAPVRVVDEAGVVAVARAASAGVGEKDAGEA